MKELSIEEKAKRYDELKVTAQELEHDGCFDKITLFDLFPELKESEDDKTRKELLDFCKNRAENYPNDPKYKNISAWIAWLENIPYTIDREKREGFHLGYKAGLEKQGEQKPTDKIEPKFKSGDWVVYDGWICQIIDVTEDGYSNSQHGFIPKNREDSMRFWTIQDAKDGDVLCDYLEEYDNPLIFILKKFERVDFGLVKPSDYSSYCFLTAGDRQMFKEGKYHHKHNIKPATKEQRNLLFQKMHEAGYEWDAEKKELKKVEKPAWSEEDEKIYQSIMDDTVQENQLNDKQTNWLRDIKYRYFPQPKQEWSEKDEMMVSAINQIIVETKEINGWNCSHIDCGNVFYEDIKTWLKSLKDRVQPKQEWSEEDEKIVSEVIQNYESGFLPSVIERDRIAKTLKSLRPKNRWKPSDEQLRQLELAIDYWQPNNTKVTTPLFKLWEDLKKLKAGKL